MTSTYASGALSPFTIISSVQILFAVLCLGIQLRKEIIGRLIVLDHCLFQIVLRVRCLFELLIHIFYTCFNELVNFFWPRKFCYCIPWLISFNSVVCLSEVDEEVVDSPTEFPSFFL